jgi:hypothetical protein
VRFESLGMHCPNNSRPSASAAQRWVIIGFVVANDATRSPYHYVGTAPLSILYPPSVIGDIRSGNPSRDNNGWRIRLTSSQNASRSVAPSPFKTTGSKSASSGIRLSKNPSPQV